MHRIGLEVAHQESSRERAEKWKPPPLAAEGRSAPGNILVYSDGEGIKGEKMDNTVKWPR